MIQGCTACMQGGLHVLLGVRAAENLSHYEPDTIFPFPSCMMWLNSDNLRTVHDIV